MTDLLFWGVDPFFSGNVQIVIHQLNKIQIIENGFYFVKDRSNNEKEWLHPITRVSVVGTIIQFQEFQEMNKSKGRRVFVIDDGTGKIQATQFFNSNNENKNKNNNNNSNNNYNKNKNNTSGYNYIDENKPNNTFGNTNNMNKINPNNDFKNKISNFKKLRNYYLGKLVEVNGFLNSYNGYITVKINNLKICTDPNEEIVHKLEAMKLWNLFLSKPFEITSEMTLVKTTLNINKKNSSLDLTNPNSLSETLSTKILKYFYEMQDKLINNDQLINNQLLYSFAADYVEQYVKDKSSETNCGIKSNLKKKTFFGGENWKKEKIKAIFIEAIGSLIKKGEICEIKETKQYWLTKPILMDPVCRVIRQLSSQKDLKIDHHVIKREIQNGRGVQNEYRKRCQHVSVKAIHSILNDLKEESIIYETEKGWQICN
ncbi:cst complex subunit stn1 [Anaeramoeba flamelloides]|uniref:Cst complex subunit stn1 n=1 Tax=Anaeramoeba flamelloides TaxID=1746091 RepID=A0AAV7YCW7_9EUKA|nr:cst complex subunit stn1 [Anaeramoeba flamelloides]